MPTFNLTMSLFFLKNHIFESNKILKPNSSNSVIKSISNINPKNRFFLDILLYFIFLLSLYKKLINVWY